MAWSTVCGSLRMVTVRIRSSGFSESIAENTIGQLLSHHPMTSARVVCGCQLELLIAVAVGLFSVGGQEVGEARAHVSGDVLHDDRRWSSTPRR